MGRFCLRQQVVAQDRCHGQRHQQRGENRDDISHAEWCEKASFDPRECEERQEDENDDRCAEDDSTADFLARLVDNQQGRSGVSRGVIFLQPAEDIFDIYDSVVDQFPHRHRNAA